jgi:hypothetical protein
MDLATLAALISGIASLLAVIGLWVELRRSRVALMTETALRLEERFYSPEMIATRQSAARKLIDGDAFNHELSEVLDFHATMTSLLKRRAIDRQLVLDLQEYWMIRYYLVSQPYILEARKYDPDSWVSLGELVDKLMAKCNDNLTSEALQLFLYEEARFDQAQIAALLPRAEEEIELERMG